VEGSVTRRISRASRNQRPAWLAQAHDRLDAAVLHAYGWPHDIATHELLERLLELNLQRAADQR
jgi:hypothetical protein